MKINDLKRRLAKEGCNPSSYAIGSRGSAADSFCLTYNGVDWQIYYTERGVDQKPFFETPNEEKACEAFYRLITGFRHDHCVGIFSSSQSADQFIEELLQEGIRCHKDQIPYNGPQDFRYRVFVRGKTILKVIEKFNDLPVTD